MSEAPTAPSPPATIASPVATATGETCANCGAAMHGAYCYACGQPRKGAIRPLSGIVADFVDTVFSLDARTWRTLWPLYFKPGFLSNEYFAGRRVRYVTPLRLYFFLSIVAFLVISASANFEGVQVEADGAQRRATADARAAHAGTAPAAGPQGEREDRPPMITLGSDKPWHRTGNPLTFAWLSDDLNAALNDEIAVLVGKIDALEEDPRPFFEELFSIAPQALFFILPLFALLLKLVYAFRRRLYMEHMIVALHSHGFLCLSLLVIVALAWLEDRAADVAFARFVVGLSAAAAGLWIPIHLLVMQRRVYRQGWLVTLLKFVVVGICYVVLLAFGLLAAILVSLIFL